jgi:hypothetical protein
LQLGGIVAPEDGLLIPAAGVGALPAVAMGAENPAVHLWEHMLERAHLWQNPPILAAGVQGSISYLAWSCAARVNDNQVPITGSFVVAPGAGFATTYLNMLHTVVAAGLAGTTDVSWSNTMGGAVPAAGVVAVQPTENLASRDQVALHLAPAGFPNILKMQLGSGGGDPRVETRGVKNEAKLTLDIACQIILTETDAATIGPRINGSTVYWNTNGTWAANAFLQTLAAGLPAALPAGSAAGSILLGIGARGNITTMFGE